MRGFTLVEILTALGIVVLVALVGMGAMTRFNRATALDSETQRVAALVKDAHDRTLASEEGANVAVHLEEDSVTLFRGSSYDADDSENEVFVLRRGVTLSHALQGGGNEIFFAQIKGTTAQSGTITVSAFGETQIIDIFGTGVVTIR